MPIKTCEICKKEFKAHHNINRFCSRVCGNLGKGGIYKDQGFKTSCLICKKVFRHKPTKKPKYCSNECYAFAQKETQKGENNHNFKNAGMKFCIGCNKQYKSYNKNKKYCSFNCAISFNNGIEVMGYGINFEREFKKILESQGWYVMRSAGSRGAADLIAINGEETALYQIKTTTKESAMNWVASMKKESKRLLSIKRHDKVNLYLVLRIKGRAWYEACISTWTEENLVENLKNWLNFIEEHPTLTIDNFIYQDILNK